ncbi:MAG: helix-turn-helix domain-containing protein [Anaerolineae bacterium]|nr:helix-turn-helix domain-containing protein [Anaerolineae bacterium]
MPVDYGEPLTERETEIVSLVAEGLTNREVAERLHVSHNTIKVHLRNIFSKTGVASRTELTVLAVQEGWIIVPGIAVEIPGEDIPILDASVPQEPIETEIPLLPDVSLPPWPIHRWVMLGVVLLLGLVVLFLPQRPMGKVALGTHDGLVDEQGGTGALSSFVATEVSWEELPPLRVRRGRLGLTAFNNRLYAVGGMTDEGTTDQLDIFDVSEKRWLTGAACPTASANIGAVVLMSQIFVPGGCDDRGQPHSNSYLYTPETDVWSETAPLPQALCAYALTVYQNRAYLFGGWDGERYQAVAYMYVLETDTWESLPSPVDARGFGGAAMLGNSIYYVGGYDGQTERDSCQVFLPDEARWETCAPLLQPRGGLGLATGAGKLYAIGGGWNEYNYLSFNERYDPNKDTWSVIDTPLVGEWRNLGMVFWDTSLYVIGGRSGDEYLNRSYVYEILPFKLTIPVIQQ